MGIVEQYEAVYAPLKQFGVPANVWDEVLEEMFGPTQPPKVPGVFQMICLAVKDGQREAADFPREDDMTDHAYVRSILEDANAFWQTLPPIDRIFWEFDPETCTSIKVLPS